MTNVEIDVNRLKKELGGKFKIESVEDILFNLGIEVSGYDEKEKVMHIEVTSDRSDLLSTFGIARMLKDYLQISRQRKLKIKNSGLYINVDRSVSEVRPFIAAVAARKLRLDDQSVKELMRLQEKLHETFCNNRTLASIGLYSFEKIKFPLHYFTQVPANITFVPLGESKIMSGDQILANTEMGKKYANILKDHKLHPLFTDDTGEVLSYPPIINSNKLGKITAQDTSILVEVTGTNLERVHSVLKLMAEVLFEMGGELEYVNIKYANSADKTPDTSETVKKLRIEQAEKLIGVQLGARLARKLLVKMGYNVNPGSGSIIKVGVPFYRHDILHNVDIMDDIFRAYGANKLVPEAPNVFTVGEESKFAKKSGFLRNAVIGLGFDEALTLALTSEKAQYTDMGITPKQMIKVQSAKSNEAEIMRTNIAPELLRMLKANDRYKLPIKLFELNDVVVRNPASDTGYGNDTRLCAVICDLNANFTSAKQLLNFVLMLFGIQYRLESSTNAMFIEGRAAKVLAKVNGNELNIGEIGEIHPQVLSNIGLESPVASLEISLNAIFGL